MAEISLRRQISCDNRRIIAGEGFDSARGASRRPAVSRDIFVGGCLGAHRLSSLHIGSAQRLGLRINLGQEFLHRALDGNDSLSIARNPLREKLHLSGQAEVE